MGAPLVDIVLLSLLVAFFGIQQRSRPQLYFRLWFLGWIFVLCSFLAWGVHGVTPLITSLRFAIEENALYLGGLAFLLSFVVRQSRFLQPALLSISVAVLAGVLFQLDRAASSNFLLLLSFILILEAAFIYLIFALLPRDWKYRRRTLAMLAVLVGLIMIVIARSGPVHHRLEDWMVAQVYLSAAILFSATGNRRSLDWYVGTLGFVAWGCSYPLFQFLHNDPALFLLLSQFWNLPKFAVGFAMTMRIFEGSRNDMVRLADSYKNLYGDFRLLYDNHPLPMWIYDSESFRFLSVNDAAVKSYGFSHQEFLTMSVPQILMPDEPTTPHSLPIPPGEEDAVPVEMSRELEFLSVPEILRPNQDSVRTQHHRKDGSIIAVEFTEHAILFQGRQARFVLAVDITEREKLNQELFHRTQHDSLTGLGNRSLLDDRIEQSLLRATREDKKAVLFTIDVDRFKLINDTYGHLVGDETLKAIADRLQQRVRSVDTIARTGGEEFTVIIGGLNHAEDGEKIATMFLRLFDTPLNLPNQDLKVSISIGGAIYPDDATESATLRKKSDQALYHAKRLGRNRSAFASSEVCASFDQARAIEMALREALRNEAFELQFQPIFDSEGCASHFEALLRMTGKSTAYTPALFIPIAEESGLIIPIGNWVVQEACRHLVAWRKLGGENISVGINVSGKQLLQKDFAAFVIATLQQHGLPPTALEIEVNESSLMSEPTFMREVMSGLANVGIRFAIDDFGTGYSSLARLADLPISLLKIDRSFIDQLHRTQRSDGIVTAIIHMAQTLQIQVVAEGVEDESQLNTLLRRGCDLFQGFYLARPLSAADMLTAFEQKSPSVFAHPHFSQTRVAVSKQVRKTTQLAAFAGKGAA